MQKWITKKAHMDVSSSAEGRYAEEANGQLCWQPEGVYEGREWLPKRISGLDVCGGRRQQGGGNPESMLWHGGAPWAGWESWSGREGGMQRKSMGQSKEVSTVHGTEASYNGAAACLLLEEGKALQKRQSWELGMSWKGSSGRGWRSRKKPGGKSGSCMVDWT